MRICSSPITVELQVTGHFSVRHSIWSLLQAERLEVNTNAAVWDDEVGVHGTLHSSCILTEKKRIFVTISASLSFQMICEEVVKMIFIFYFFFTDILQSFLVCHCSRWSYSRVALAWQSVALQAWRQRDVVDDRATAATLQTHLGGLRPHRCGRDDDAVYLHQTGHLLGLQVRETAKK